MVELQWEEIKNNHGNYIHRAKVFGGWLIKHLDNAYSYIDEGYDKLTAKTGYQWRTSITFIPDANHEWQ